RSQLRFCARGRPCCTITIGAASSTPRTAPGEETRSVAAGPELSAVLGRWPNTSKSAATATATSATMKTLRSVTHSAMRSLLVSCANDRRCDVWTRTTGKPPSCGRRRARRRDLVVSRAAELAAARRDAARCRRCELWRNATQTVFGEGTVRARAMLVGEQPGDVEDEQGRPFVGPAGALLREVLREVGLREKDVYLTNTVKHFKWRPKGTR